MRTPTKIHTPPFIQTGRLAPTKTKLILLISSLALLLCGAAQAQSVRPQRIPNSKRYSDKGMHPATGRSGSASLTVRALLGKDGKTDVEMTTGTLDSQQTPPGHIRKAQLKPLNQDGDAIYARNYTGLNGGGYFATQVNDLHRLQQVQAQVNIDGIDARRTSVVTVVETVKKRPDLALSDLSPATGLLGTPVNITVVARELNGDVSAYADCVLYADGEEIDRAHGIFVDAGGVVTVAFTHVFTTTGAKQIRAELVNVTPGDWDAANNSVSGTLNIIQPNDTLNYQASIYDEETTYTSQTTHQDGSNDPTNGYLMSFGNDTSTSIARQSAQLNGYTRHYSSFPYHVTVNESSGDASLLAADLDVAADSTFNLDFGFFTYAVSTGFATDPTQNTRVYVSNILIDFGGSSYVETDVSYQRDAGSVTYQSSGYDKYWYLDNGVRRDLDDYTYNNSGGSTDGTRLAIGPQYTIFVSLTSGDASPQVFSAAPTMDVAAVGSSFVLPQTCSNFRFPDPPATVFFFGSDCEQTGFSSVVKSGSKFFSGAP